MPETSRDRVLRALRRIIRAVDRYSRKLAETYEVTGPQLICLAAIAEHQPLTLSDLSRRVALGPSTVNGIVDRLERKAWVARSRGTRDRRKVYVSATEAGQTVLAGAPPLLQDTFSAALAELPEERQAEIAASLERVVELMGAQDIPAAPALVAEAMPDTDAGNSTGQAPAK